MKTLLSLKRADTSPVLNHPPPWSRECIDQKPVFSSGQLEDWITCTEILPQIILWNQKFLRQKTSLQQLHNEKATTSPIWWSWWRVSIQKLFNIPFCHQSRFISCSKELPIRQKVRISYLCTTRQKDFNFKLSMSVFRVKEVSNTNWPGIKIGHSRNKGPKLYKRSSRKTIQ